MVMKSGVVGGNAHRRLQVEEFRGFTVSDPFAPAIFINGSDTRAAQVFTLAHELAHVWLDRSGISNERIDAFPAVSRNNEVELKCNAVAAELLVPEAQFEWDTSAGLDSNLRSLSKHFSVSSLVILRRGRDLGFVTQKDFSEAYGQRLASFIAKEEEQSGGDFYLALYARNSIVFTESLLGALKQGKASYTEAAQMLHVKVPTLSKIIGDLESRRHY